MFNVDDEYQARKNKININVYTTLHFTIIYVYT